MSRYGRHRHALTLIIAMTCHASPPVAADPVTLTTLERSVAAFAEAGTPDSEVVTATTTGAFSHEVSAYSSRQNCLPFGGKCIIRTARGTARQDSIVALAGSGGLEVRARGEARASVSFAGETNTQSSLTVGFDLTEAADFRLRSEASGPVNVVLAGVLGPVVDWPSPTDDTDERGRLMPGSYTLHVAADAAINGSSNHALAVFDVRFSAAPRAATTLRCDLEASAPGYGPGDMATLNMLQVYNLVPHHRALEMKLWMREPSGQVWPVLSDGADASVLIPAGVIKDFGPVPLFEVSADTPVGIHEFGCRILDPWTGETLFDESELFEVRP